MGGDLPDYTDEIMEDAFPDYTPRLLAFMENNTADQQLKSSRPEGFQLEGLQPKGQRPKGQKPRGQRLEGQGPAGQENQS